MNPKRFLIIAGEPSGDVLAAELVAALERRAGVTSQGGAHTAGTPVELVGAGGPRMAAAGVEMAFEMTSHAVVGLWEAIKHAPKFRRLMRRLVLLAAERKPDAIICVDFPGFNLRLAAALKRYARARQHKLGNWEPKVIQYVSPQVWASRERRAHKLAGRVDLLLAIFPFEKNWYAKRAPELRVEFIGHPVVDRYSALKKEVRESGADEGSHVLVLLPGSRRVELEQHLPVMVEAAYQLLFQYTAQLRSSMRKTPDGKSRAVELRMVLPDANLLEVARPFLATLPHVQIQVGELANTLAQAELAIAATGTVTLECAYFGVPTVAIYKTSWSTYQIAKRLIKVKYLAMPNLLANDMIYPELIQEAATSQNIVRESLELLLNNARRTSVISRLTELAESLGPPGACDRAAEAIWKMLEENGPKK